MPKFTLTALALIAAAGIGYAAGVTRAPGLSTLDSKALQYILPENIPWQPATGLPGADTYALLGDQSKPGFYIVLNRFHPGSFSRPHYHENDRYIMVLNGTWWAATGATYDPERTVGFKPGTFVVHAGRQVHWDGSRAGGEDAIVMIFGQGPGTRHDCTGAAAETGPGPCADALKTGLK
jgi:hypothetical protein